MSCSCTHIDTWNPCTCSKVITTSTTTTTTICLNGEPCEEAVDPRCIIYCGPAIPCYGIEPGDSAADIMNVILDTFYCGITTTTTTTTTTLEPLVCICRTYLVQNPIDSLVDFTYMDCENGKIVSFNVAPLGSTTVCACINTVNDFTNAGLIVTEESSCDPRDRPGTTTTTTMAPQIYQFIVRDCNGLIYTLYANVEYPQAGDVLYQNYNLTLPAIDDFYCQDTVGFTECFVLNSGDGSIAFNNGVCG
jgi:hypothetical protein